MMRYLWPFDDNRSQRATPTVRFRRFIALCGLGVAGCGQDVAQNASPPVVQEPGEPVASDQEPADEFPPLDLQLPTAAPPSEFNIDVDRNAATPQPAMVDDRLPLRLSDDRPSINDLRLQQAGIQRYESERLILLSDLPADDVRHLPELADALFAALESHFGKLPEAPTRPRFR